MARIKQIALSESQKADLEQGNQREKRRVFRQRCQRVLLKSKIRASSEVAQILDCCEVSVNTWLRRYEQEGLEGLKTKSGLGRKPNSDDVQDLAAVKDATLSLSLG